MDSFLIVILVILVVVLFGALVFIAQRLRELKNAGAVELIKTDITELNRTIQNLQQAVGDKLDKNSNSVQDSVQKQLSESAKLVANVTERLTKLDETNRRVVDVADELKSLQNVLQNPKQRGVLGEFYLDQILQNLLPPGSYETQYKIADGLIVDAAIKLDGRILPIDSKFSLENYNRMVEAKGEKKEALAKQLRDDLKKRIDETSKYIQPRKGTLDQALMFIPSEAIYYDLLANRIGSSGVNGRDLMQYAAVDKRVTIVGPSTLSAMLQIIVQGLRSLEIQKDTEVIRGNIEKLTKHLVNYDGYFKKVGVSLGATVGHYNSASKELGRIDKDIIKIAGSESAIETMLLDKPNTDKE
jgi:DNA recombination protein RmuC